jgi:TRAP-type uncharacterized transport system fused permease subunit
MVHLEAVKTNVKRMDPEEIPPLKETITKGGLLLIPLVVVILILLKCVLPNEIPIVLLIYILFKEDSKDV